MSIPIVKDFDDLAESIANPPPNRPIGRAVGNFGRKVCDAVSNNPELYAPTFLQWPILALCQPYYDNEGISPPEESPPPFPGGQCPANYTFFYQGRNSSGGGNFEWSVTVGTGGIGPLSVRPDPVEAAPGPLGNGLFQNNAELVDGNGNRIVRLALGATDDPEGWRFISLSRNDGQPDNCGSLPPTLVPGINPAPDPGPIPPDTGPRFDIRGNPIFVLPPTLEVTPTVNVELPIGEINLGSGDGGGPAEIPSAGEPIDGAGANDGGGENDFGEPPPGERWVGCCINITTSPVGQGIIQSSLPHDIYPSTIGNVRLKFQGVSGPITYDTPIVKRQQSTCIWEPVRGLAPVGCFVNLLPAFSYTVTPYSVPLEQ